MKKFGTISFSSEAMLAESLEDFAVANESFTIEGFSVNVHPSGNTYYFVLYSYNKVDAYVPPRCQGPGFQV
jgi:hypothetical protein